MSITIKHQYDPSKVVSIWREPVTPPWKNSDGRSPNPLYCGALKDGTLVYRYHSSGVRAVVKRLGLTSYALESSSKEAWLTKEDFLKVRDDGIRHSAERHQKRLYSGAPSAVSESGEHFELLSAQIKKKLTEISAMDSMLVKKAAYLEAERLTVKGQREMLAVNATSLRGKLELIEEYHVLRLKVRDLYSKIIQ